MKKIYRVWRSKPVEVALGPDKDPELDGHDHDTADVQVRERVADIPSCSIQDAEDAIDADIQKRSQEGEFGGHWSGDIGSSDFVYNLPEGEELGKVQAEYSVTEEFVKA